MELKVACYCGQKYKFDVDPVNGQMPYAINCPVCGVDGTPLANQLLTQQLNPSVPAPAPAPVIAPVAAPASGMGLRINRPSESPAPEVPPVLAAAGSTPPPLAQSRAAVKAAPIKPLMNKPIAAPKDFRMGLGILGAFLGAAIGGGLMFGFTMLTDFRFPLMGTAIGVLTGLGARILARGTDSALGGIAAGFALVSVCGTLFLIYGTFPLTAIITIGVAGYFAYRLAS
jgi:hypothetical protein